MRPGGRPPRGPWRPKTSLLPEKAGPSPSQEVTREPLIVRVEPPAQVFAWQVPNLLITTLALVAAPAPFLPVEHLQMQVAAAAQVADTNYSGMPLTLLAAQKPAPFSPVEFLQVAGPAQVQLTEIGVNPLLSARIPPAPSFVNTPVALAVQPDTGQIQPLALALPPRPFNTAPLYPVQPPAAVQLTEIWANPLLSAATAPPQPFVGTPTTLPPSADTNVPNLLETTLAPVVSAAPFTPAAGLTPPAAGQILADTNLGVPLPLRLPPPGVAPFAPPPFLAAGGPAQVLADTSTVAPLPLRLVYPPFSPIEFLQVAPPAGVTLDAIGVSRLVLSPIPFKGIDTPLVAGPPAVTDTPPERNLALLVPPVLPAPFAPVLQPFVIAAPAAVVSLDFPNLAYALVAAPPLPFIPTVNAVQTPFVTWIPADTNLAQPLTLTLPPGPPIPPPAARKGRPGYDPGAEQMAQLLEQEDDILALIMAFLMREG